MISDYLTLLYSNCKIFAKTISYSKEALSGFFRNQLTQTCFDDRKFNSEQDIVNFLLSGSVQELDLLFEKSKYLQIFYLVNSLNEYRENNNSYDDLGRFKYTSSVAKTYGITNNLVMSLMKDTVENDPFLKSSFAISNHKSYFFLSHDIDSVYGSMVQDGMWAAKKGRIDVLCKLFFNLVTAKPHWLNFNRIMKTESEYDFKSTFYWLVNKGRIDARQTNSDYAITSPQIVNEIKTIEANGFENGLHKSISNESFKTELSKLPVKAVGNRYHYLKFKLPDAYDAIEKSGLKLDASLGFAEHYGFRNNYGFPFHPYNVKDGTAYSFLEVPLTIMDGTFQRYMQIPVHKTADTVIEFLEKNNQNALLSILWHNTFFSDYKYNGYLAEYKKILAYLYEEKFQHINQSQIISEFSWQTK